MATKLEIEYNLKADHLCDLKELLSHSKRNNIIWVNAKIKRFEKELKELDKMCASQSDVVYTEGVRNG